MNWIVPKQCPKSLVSFNNINYGLFVITLIINYYFIRYFSKKQNWELRQKTNAQDLQDITVMLILGTISFTFGNYANTFNWLTISSLTITSIIFTWITNIPAFKTSLVGYKNWDIKVWILMIILLISMLLFGVYTFTDSYNCHTLTQELVYLTIATVWVILMFILNRGNITHIHHYQIAWILSFFSPFDSVVSRIFSGIVLSIFVNGIAVYGPDPSVK
jgi:hypothetical protein